MVVWKILPGPCALEAGTSLDKPRKQGLIDLQRVSMLPRKPLRGGGGSVKGRGGFARPLPPLQSEFVDVRAFINPKARMSTKIEQVFVLGQFAAKLTF